MKYYSEDDVMDLIKEAEDCERAYEWGEWHRRIHFEDYHPIEIPDKHGRLIDAGSVKKILRSGVSLDCNEDVKYVCGLIDEIPTVIEASTKQRQGD